VLTCPGQGVLLPLVDEGKAQGAARNGNR
jgi:hypothetical protein